MSEKTKYEDLECGDIIETCFDKVIIIESKKDGFVIGHELGEIHKGMQKEGYKVLNREFRYKKNE